MTPQLSIVTTLYKSQHYIETFLDKALAAGEACGKTFEIVVVDDGSPDESRILAERRASLDSRIRVIELSRNFGHHAAFWCAMHYAKGEQCFLIDSDLEVDPAVLPVFQEKMAQTNADVVYGVQETRQGSASTRVMGGLFWKLFSKLSDVDVPSDIMTERLLTRRYLDALLSMQDKNLFLGGMFYWPGFQQIPLKLTKAPRQGQSSYNLLNRFTLLVQALSSFSSAPLALVFWFGVFVFLITFAYSAYLLLRRIFFPETLVDGFTFLALISMASSGTVLIALGIIGLYIHKLFRQVQGRPIFIVKNIYSKKEEA